MEQRFPKRKVRGSSPSRDRRTGKMNFDIPLLFAVGFLSAFQLLGDVVFIL